MEGDRSDRVNGSRHRGAPGYKRYKGHQRRLGGRVLGTVRLGPVDLLCPR